MADDSDDFFDAFKNKVVTKTEKFSFKKVEKNNSKPSESETVSRFFKKDVPEKSKQTSVEDELEALFSDSSIIEQSPIKQKFNSINKKDEKIKNTHSKAKFNFTNILPKSNSSDYFEEKLPTQKISSEEKTMDTKSSLRNIHVQFKYNNPSKSCTSKDFKEKKKPSMQNVLVKEKDVTETKTSIKNSNSPTKFQFKKKNLNTVVSQAFETLFGEKITPKENIKKILELKPKNSEEFSKQQKSDECTESKPEDKSFITTNKINESLNTSDLSSDSLFTAKKKFTFKKPISSESGSSSSPNNLSLNSKLNNTKRNSIISISSAESSPIIWQSKKLDNKKTLNDEVIISQSLCASENDYMDDETFEKLFGDNKTKSENELNSFDLQDINWDEEIIQNEASTSKNIEDTFTAEVSAIDWNDEAFKDQEEKLYIPEISFKDRQDDAGDFQKTYHFSSVMEEVLHQKFGLQSFRPQQREVINAALNQHDCFVLMPTGGGKSLCYQLPAILSDGVSIVISPLRALIGDQVDKMNGLDIPAAHMCQDVGVEETGMIMAKLHSKEPLIKLLYLTPEKIMASRAVSDILKSLYQRGKLSRFVIDEAHCLSQWGHDFRPDYKQMSFLKREFEKVPIMCLTATATKQVENDVITILKLKNVKRFIMSFNRPNIKYQVIPKKGRFANEEIIGLIKKKFLKKSGIIYCFARNDCESLADTLNNAGIKSRPYHAGLSDKIRNAIQREWMQDRFFVIVATIAFGMGIDKPDVRFVIHNSLPKSVEAFYQESGRAGRDGDISYSYLFYNYADVVRLQKIMNMERRQNAHVIEGHSNSLKQMVSFAENVVDCRRYLQLIHLGENFDRQLCIRNKATTCDNCENINTYKSIEVTKEARQLGTLVKDLSERGNITMLHVVDVYKGSKIKKILQMGHDKHKFYGAGSSMDKTDIQRILKDLVLKNILGDLVTHVGEFPVVYIITGNKFNALNAQNLQINIPVNKKSTKNIFSAVVDDCNVNDEVIDCVEVLDAPGPSTLPPLTGVTSKKGAYSAFNKTKINKLKIECHEALLEECRRMALERNLTLSSIMNLTAIKSMSEVLPKTKEEFLKIQHVTAANYKKCGDSFLAITSKFREKVDALDTAPKIIELSNDDWSSSLSQASSRGTKRKFTGAYKKWGSKRKKTYRKKKSSPKKKTGTGWKGSQTKNKSGGKSGGGVGLMPIHFK